MDFFDAVKVLLRRWRVLVVGAVAVLAAAAAAVVVVPTQYQATGQLVMLLPPQATGAATPTNPYLNLEPGLTVTASLIASTLSTKDAARSLDADGFTSDYAIGLSPDAGPVLVISAEDTDGAMAVRTRDEVIRRLQQELARIQSEVNAPQRQLIGASTNSVPPVAEPLPGSKIRALAVIGGVGVVSTLMVAFLRDRRRSLVRPEQAVQAAASGAPPRYPPPPVVVADHGMKPDEKPAPHRRRRDRVGASTSAGWWDS